MRIRFTRIVCAALPESSVGLARATPVPHASRRIYFDWESEVIEWVLLRQAQFRQDRPTLLIPEDFRDENRGEIGVPDYYVSHL